MRKWMSERLKRRKKEPQKAGSEAAPAPLQPAFYDTEPSHPEPVADVVQATPAPLRPESAHDMSAEPQAEQPRQPANGDVAKRRRRRGRGGRGRSRNDASPAEPASAVLAQHGREGTAAAAPLPQVEAPQRPSKGVVILAIGLPGSGKSSWFKRHNVTPLSSDLLRAL